MNRTEESPRQELPRFAPLALSAQLISGTVHDTDVLLVSFRSRNWLYLDPEEVLGGCFPYIKSFEIAFPNTPALVRTKQWHYILLDCGSASGAANVFDYYSLNRIAEIKKHLVAEEGILMVLLSGNTMCDNAIGRNVISVFPHVYKLRVDTMEFLIASDRRDPPITDIDLINQRANLLGFYDYDDFPFGAFSVILSPRWQILPLPDLHQVPRTTSRDPVLLRIGAAMHMPDFRKSLAWVEMYGQYCLLALLALYLVIRYFATGTPDRKNAFHSFEQMFLLTISCFCVQYALSFFDVRRFMLVWPLVCAGILLLLELFAKKTSPSMLKKICYMLMVVLGCLCLFLTPDFVCIAGACLVVLPIVCTVRAIPLNAGPVFVVLQSASGSIFALIVVQFLLFCAYGPVMLAVLIVFMTAARMKSIPR